MKLQVNDPYGLVRRVHAIAIPPGAAVFRIVLNRPFKIANSIGNRLVIDQTGFVATDLPEPPHQYSSALATLATDPEEPDATMCLWTLHQAIEGMRIYP